MAKKRVVSLADRSWYHQKRRMNPSAYGLKYGDPKHAYSQGFDHGVQGYGDDYEFIKDEFGKKSAFAYLMGRSRARKLKWSKEERRIRFGEK